MFCRFRISIFAPVVKKGPKNDIFGEDGVTWTLPTFYRIDIYYSGIWFGISCRCAIRFRNFYFNPRGQMRVNQQRFLFFCKFVTWTTFTFSGVDNWYSRIWLGMSCRYEVRIRNFLFAPWGQMTVEKWHFMSLKAGHLNYTYISKRGMSCWCSIRFLNVSFDPWVK